MALSSLEEQLNSPVFDRHGKKLMLNEHGRILLSKAVNILSQTKELQDLMATNKANTLVGHLIIGASTTIGNYLLPPIIGDFLAENSQVKITLKIDNTKHIIQSLHNFDIDIGIIEGNCHAENIEVLPWLRDELIIIASPKHPFSKKKTLTQKDLQALKWILREPGSGTREIFEKAMGGSVNTFLELGNNEAIKQAVQSGLGVSCLSKLTVVDALKNKQLIELKAPSLNLTRKFFILLHKDKYKTKVLGQFLQRLKNH